MVYCVLYCTCPWAFPFLLNGKTNNTTTNGIIQRMHTLSKLVNKWNHHNRLLVWSAKLVRWVKSLELSHHKMRGGRQELWVGREIGWIGREIGTLWWTWLRSVGGQSISCTWASRAPASNAPGAFWLAWMLTSCRMWCIPWPSLWILRKEVRFVPSGLVQ